MQHLVPTVSDDPQIISGALVQLLDRIGPAIDPIQTLMVAGSGRDVRTVVVDGRVVVQNGLLAGFDAVAEHRQAQAQYDGMIAKYPDRTFGHPPVADIFPPTYPLDGSP
jgi:hypothetical protein